MSKQHVGLKIVHIITSQKLITNRVKSKKGSSTHNKPDSYTIRQQTRNITTKCNAKYFVKAHDVAVSSNYELYNIYQVDVQLCSMNNYNR